MSHLCPGKKGKLMSGMIASVSVRSGRASFDIVSAFAPDVGFG
jgi:hypothetical protein